MGMQSSRASDSEIIKRYSDMVYRMAFSLLKNKYDAEDIHQEVFVKYFRKRPEFENSQHERAWFLQVTVNLCRNFWKTVWRQRVTCLGDEELERASSGWKDRLPRSEVHSGNRDLSGAESFSESGGPADEIISVVKQLPQKYRIVIHLFYYEELSTEEIARVLKKKPSTVRTQLTRARRKLRELLENVPEGETGQKCETMNWEEEISQKGNSHRDELSGKNSAEKGMKEEERNGGKNLYSEI